MNLSIHRVILDWVDGFLGICSIALSLELSVDIHSGIVFIQFFHPVFVLIFSEHFDVVVNQSQIVNKIHVGGFQLLGIKKEENSCFSKGKDKIVIPEDQVSIVRNDTVL